MIRKAVIVCVAGVVWTAGVRNASAQPAPMKPWTIGASAGLALTSGNSDTSTVNAAYDFAYDPHNKNVVKSDGLLIRGKTQGVVSNSRLSLGARDEYSLSERTLIYGRNEYLKDRFKNIDYLVAPTGGFGYKLVNTDKTKLGVDAGIGGVWEKNLGVPVNSSGAVTAGEKLVNAFSPTASLTQSITALWKTSDFQDSLYTASVSIGASMTARTQLKVEVLETYKNRPPVVTVKKSDVAVLMAIVFKM
jgi:putative salt-induced outer membrane protein YdiY